MCAQECLGGQLPVLGAGTESGQAESPESISRPPQGCPQDLPHLSQGDFALAVVLVSLQCVNYG